MCQIAFSQGFSFSSHSPLHLHKRFCNHSPRPCSQARNCPRQLLSLALHLVLSVESHLYTGDHHSLSCGRTVRNVQSNQQLASLQWCNLEKPPAPCLFSSMAWFYVQSVVRILLELGFRCRLLFALLTDQIFLSDQTRRPAQC